MRRLLAFVLAAGCAASAPPPAPHAAPAAVAPEGPPEGSKRLPASIRCEPEPPCAGDCVAAQGEAGRRLGSLDKEDIRKVIRAHVDEARSCYDAIATTKPAAVGKVMVRFGIAPSGAVETSCLVSSELDDESVDRCLLDMTHAWRFPKPEGGGWVVVSYPFVFTR